jgi:hypothetical protein
MDVSSMVFLSNSSVIRRSAFSHSFRGFPSLLSQCKKRISHLPITILLNQRRVWTFHGRHLSSKPVALAVRLTERCHSGPTAWACLATTSFDENPWLKAAEVKDMPTGLDHRGIFQRFETNRAFGPGSRQIVWCCSCKLRLWFGDRVGGHKVLPFCGIGVANDFAHFWKFRQWCGWFEAGRLRGVLNACGWTGERRFSRSLSNAWEI